jgi:hypothetical protein
MSKRSPHVGEESSLPTCANCVHTFREKARHEMVVCVPHLKTMPANNSTVCDLHAEKKKS